MTYSVDSAGLRYNNLSRKEKIWAWIQWRTPLKRWLVKPRYVQVELADELEALRECSDAGDFVTDELLNAVRGMKVWAEKWPDNPFEIFDFGVTIVPEIPVDYIRLVVTLDRDD